MHDRPPPTGQSFRWVRMYGGDLARAMEALGLSRSSLYRRMKRLGILRSECNAERKAV